MIIYARFHVHTYICVYIWVYICIYMHILVHIYMYVCTQTSSLIIHLDCDAIILVPNSHIVNPNVPTLKSFFAPYSNLFQLNPPFHMITLFTSSKIGCLHCESKRSDFEIICCCQIQLIWFNLIVLFLPWKLFFCEIQSVLKAASIQLERDILMGDLTWHVKTIRVESCEVDQTMAILVGSSCRDLAVADL